GFYAIDLLSLIFDPKKGLMGFSLVLQYSPSFVLRLGISTSTRVNLGSLLCSVLVLMVAWRG
ncbi:hypothetical protein, partial [Bradyrhizobium sp. TM233]|uniref:hypothetical protein n=1 Tax=Bradyrhizobium sp. TM233 TaxID=2599801 RepID=UPI0030C69CF0